jgi:hypothetical protein
MKPGINDPRQAAGRFLFFAFPTFLSAEGCVFTLVKFDTLSFLSASFFRNSGLLTVNQFKKMFNSATMRKR